MGHSRARALGRVTLRCRLRRSVADELTKVGNVGGEFEGAGGSLAAPEGNGGRLAVASSTRTRPERASTRRMRQLVLPRSMMSPAWDSMAKSSSRVPMTVSSGRATTLSSAVSGMAPPEVMAARREPRRARRRWLTWSR